MHGVVIESSFELFDEIEVGDRLIFSAHAGVCIDEKEELFVLTDKDILCLYKEEAQNL